MSKKCRPIFPNDVGLQPYSDSKANRQTNATRRHFHLTEKPERFNSFALSHIHSNTGGPDLDMAHSIPTLNSSPDQSNSTSDLQPYHSSSLQPSLKDVNDAPNRRDPFLKATNAEVDLISAESTRNLEYLSPGNDTKCAQTRGNNMEELGLCHPAWSTESAEEARSQLSAGRNISCSISDRIGNGMLEGRSSPTKESEGSQKDVTCIIVNGTTTFVDSFRDIVAYGDKQNFRAYRSETEAGEDTNEAETRLDVSIETKPRGSETRSRLEPCAETKPGLNETCETKTGFGNIEKSETGFGDIGETETGFGDTGETESGFGQRNSKQNRRSASSSSTSSASTEWKFDAAAIATVTHELLQRTLAPVTYDPHRCRVLSHDLAGQILATILGLASKRYKLVTFVSIGSLKDDPGVQFGSRCLWDADTDGLATVRYANETLFAVVMVYGLYRE